MSFSYQLYSSRNFTPWDNVFKTLSDLGYTQVEGFGGILEDAQALRAQLDANGLSMPSSHMGLDMLEGDFDKAIATANTLGIQQIYCPFLLPDLRPTDAAGWAVFAERLEVIAKKVKAAGLSFGWHNHDFEFVACEDGTVPMKAILDGAPSVEWEADIAWIVRGGADPMAWIAAHGNRITAAHVKDLAPEGEKADEDGWADVGDGIMDWAGLITALRANDVTLLVAEHDNPSDADRFAARSLAALKTY